MSIAVYQYNAIQAMTPELRIITCLDAAAHACDQRNDDLLRDTLQLLIQSINPKHSPQLAQSLCSAYLACAQLYQHHSPDVASQCLRDMSATWHELLHNPESIATKEEKITH